MWRLGSCESVPCGWERMVTLGQNEFQFGYLFTLSSISQTTDAGASISMEACVGRITDSRGTTIVVRPEDGGH